MIVPARPVERAGTRFRDLGTVLVEHDGDARPAGGTRLDTALALLLVHADQRVGSDALVVAIWGADAAPRSTSTLDTHVWRLRKLVEPDRPPGEPSTRLVHDHGGFRLVVRPDEVDSLVFERLAHDVDVLLGSGRPDRALDRADEALALWRGRPFTPLSDEPWAAPTVARLEQTCHQVRERRIEALLATGDAARALRELEGALVEAPLREGLWAHRMLAHHRLGRPEDALRAYRDARACLIGELGVEPGAELRELQARILADDPSLAAPVIRPAVGPAVPVVRLPRPRGPLVGRHDDLRRVAELLGAEPVTTLIGSAGCGKTRLALETARSTAGRFPDGVWFVDLAAAADPSEVRSAVTSAVGLVASSTGTPREALRAISRGRRMLLVLDNCEHVLDAAADLVDDLLDEREWGLAVLATSREPLEVDGEHVHIVHPLPVPGPDDDDPVAAPAVDLLLRRLPATPGRDLTGDEIADAARIAVAVDGLPLALELAAGRARAYTLSEIADQVMDDPSSLASIGRGTPGRHLTLREAIDGSYRLLPPAEATVHRMLAAVPGPVTAGLAAALVDGTTAGPDVVDHLTRLVHRSLLVPVGPRRPGGPSRFAQLATVRGQAAYRAGDDGCVAVDRRDGWSVQLARSRPRTGAPTERSWMDAVDDDLAALRATLHHRLVDAPGAAGVVLASRLGLYWYYRGMVGEAQRWLELAGGVKHAEPVDRALVRLNLGAAYCMQNRGDLGVAILTAGLAEARANADVDPILVGDGLAMMAGPLFVVGARNVLGDVAASLGGLAASSQDAHLGVLAEVGDLHLRLLDEAPPEELLDRCEAVHGRAVAIGNSYAAWLTALRAATTCLLVGAPVRGLTWSERMVETQCAVGNRNGAAPFAVRAMLLARAGEAREAVRLFAATRTHHRFSGLHWPRDEQTRALLGRATSALDRRTAEEAQAEGHRLTLDDLGAEVTGGSASRRVEPASA